MHEPILIPRGKHETGAELKRIIPQAVLPMAGSLRPGPGGRVVFAQQMKQVCRVQLRRFVSPPLGIDEKRKRDAGLVLERPGILHVAQPDGGQFGSSLFEFVLVLAQLRDMLAAEDSPVVPQENHHRGTFLPQRSEPNFAASGFRQDENCEPAAEGLLHAPYCIGRGSLAGIDSTRIPS